MNATDVRNDLGELAPRFRAAVESALAACQEKGLDVVVYEARRTEERQISLYAQGRSRPGQIVTNVRDAKDGWHFFGLAVDVISRTRGWSAPQEWWERVANVFCSHGCDWGGDWAHFKDLPHFQWGRCKSNPSDRARALYAAGGLEAVWREVGATDAPAPAVVPPQPLLDTTPDILSEVHLPPPSRPAIAEAPIPTQEEFMAEQTGGIKDLVKQELEKLLTEENTDRVLALLAKEAKIALPDLPVDVVEKVLDAILPGALLKVVDEVL